jgi:outer membrane protein
MTTYHTSTYCATVRATIMVSAMLAVMLLTAGFAAAETLSLGDAVVTALDNNYSISVVRLAEDVAAARNTWGAAGRYPTVSASLTAGGRMSDNDDGDSSNESLTPSVTLTWVLFNGFAIRTSKERLDTLEGLSRGNTAVLVEQTVEAVMLAYYRVLLERESLAVLSDVRDLSQDRYEKEEMRRELGSAVTFDVLQAQNAWLADKADYLRQEVTLRNAVRDLSYIMGEEDDAGVSDWTFSDPFEPPSDGFDADVLRSRMIAGNRTLKNQYLQIALLDHEIELARSGYFPQLSLRGGTEAPFTRRKLEGFDPDTGSNRDLYGSLTLSFNLFDGGARKRALTIAQIERGTGDVRTIDMVHCLDNELAKLVDLYAVRRELLSVADENLAASRLNMELAEERFRAGTINSFNYRDVQLIYLNASFGRLRAISGLIETHTALLRITGGIIDQPDE